MMVNWHLTLVVIGYVGRMVLCEDGKVCSAFCIKLRTDSSLLGKLCADIYHVNKASSRGKSKYYWINSTSSIRVYCDMELECGGVKGEWTRVAYLDMTLEHSCPSPWSSVTMGTSKQVWRAPNNPGRYSVYVSVVLVNYN